MYPKRSPAGEGDGGGNAGEPGTKQDEGTGAASAGTGSTGAAEPTAGADRMFSQAELQAIVAREVRKAKDPDIERKAREFDRIQQEQQTEAERAETARKAAEEQAQRAIAEANRRLISAELKLQLASQGARPEAVDLAVEKLLSNDNIEVDDKGAVRGAEQAVKDLLKQHEYLKAPDKPAAPDRSGGEHTGTDTPTVDQQIADAEAKGDWKLARQLKLRKYETRT